MSQTADETRISNAPGRKAQEDVRFRDTAWRLAPASRGTEQRATVAVRRALIIVTLAAMPSGESRP
jgi:hypothetical protein